MLLAIGRVQRLKNGLYDHRRGTITTWLHAWAGLFVGLCMRPAAPVSTAQPTGPPCLQVTLPARFLTTTAHFIAVVTILFDVVCVTLACLHNSPEVAASATQHCDAQWFPSCRGPWQGRFCWHTAVMLQLLHLQRWTVLHNSKSHAPWGWTPAQAYQLSSGSCLTQQCQVDQFHAACAWVCHLPVLI